MKIPRPLIDIVAALLFFVLAGIVVASWAGAVSGPLRVPLVVVSQGVLVLLVVAALLAWRGHRWADIGLVAAPRPRDAGRALAAFAACLGVNMLFVYLLYAVSPGTVEGHTEQLGSIARQLTHGLSLPGLVGILVFVGVYEEVFARGLLLERCRALLGGTLAPVLVSSLLFGLGHAYQGWIGVGQTTLIGLVLAVLTIRWGTLWPAIIAHALLDIASIVFMGQVLEGGG